MAADGGRENVSTALKTLSPKPIITRVVRSWAVQPGMVFAVAEDIDRQVWIVESTPVGTHCWTVQQAAELPQGVRTRHALREALRLGFRLEEEYASPSGGDELSLSAMLPRYTGESDDTATENRPIRAGRRRKVKEPLCV